MQWRPLCTITANAGETYLLNVQDLATPASPHGAGLNGYALQAIASGGRPAAAVRLLRHGHVQQRLGHLLPGRGGAALRRQGARHRPVGPGRRQLGHGHHLPEDAVGSRAPQPVRDAPATCTYTASPDPNPVNTTGGAWGSTGSQYTTAQPSDSAHQVRGRTPRRPAPPSGSTTSGCTSGSRSRPTTRAPSGVNPETTAGSCWWGITYDFSAQPYDVTTWKARIEGNPVHLTS